MTDAGYVVAGWVIAGGVLGGYTVRLALRLRRAEAEQADEGPRG
ncbi:MAG: hypothetical protein ACXVJ7_08575 [Acidimicrobiia bacterium]